jgi:hypothetical protein
MFVLLDSDSAQLTEAFRKLLQEEELADLMLYARTVRDNERQAELVDYLRKRYSWDSGPRWAFIAPDERCLAQGVATPDAKALADQLANAGVESQVRRLRAFVRRYPENLDGRLALLDTLRSIANERTRGAIGAQPGQRQERRGQDGGRQDVLFGPARRLLRAAEMAESDEKPVQLPAEDDLRIWARWADEFDWLMGSGQWMESDFAFEYGGEALDKHSSIVKNIYKKRIGLVEDALRRWPGSDRYWGIWLHMSLVIGDMSAKRLVNNLAPIPGTAPSAWPPYEAKLVLIQEARRNGDWRDLRDMLWESWLEMSQTLTSMQSAIQQAMRGMGRNSAMRTIMSRSLEGPWRQLLSPLIESLLMTGDVAGADSVLSLLKEAAGWDEVYGLAAETAIRCQMPQVAERWKQ